VYIERRLCSNCGICIEMCSMGVFGMVDGDVFPVRMHLCITCLQCADFCPTHAISTRWTVRA
jgi:energy-converting hydrogenase B subunit K